MSNSYSQLLRQRSLILDQMAALDRMQRGRLSEQYLKGQKDGQTVLHGPYYVLQRRVGKDVQKERVPAERLDTLRADIENHQRFQELAEDYARLSEEMAQLQDADPGLKKKPKPSRAISSRRPRPS